MTEIEYEDIDFDIDEDITNDSIVPSIKSGAKEKKLSNNNHVTNEVVVLSDSDEECIILNDEEETSKHRDVSCVKINNIVVHCVSVNSCTQNVDNPGNVTNVQNKRQKRNKQDKCVIINDDENECVIVNCSDNPKRKIRKNNNFEPVSFNSIGKLVTLDEDKDIKCDTSNNGENIQLNIVTLNDSKNLISLLVNNEVNVNSTNNNFQSIDDEHLVQSNGSGNTTEEFFEVALNDNCTEPVVKVEDISITIEKCIDNEVEKCILNEQSNEECIKNEESIQKYANSDDKLNVNCIKNEQSDEECMEWNGMYNEQDNMDENAFNKGCRLNLFDSEFTIEEEFNKNVINSNDSLKNNESSSQLFECELCAYKSPSINGLLEHLRSHSLGKNFSCTMCKYKCKYKSSLEAHVIAEHKKVKLLKCPMCRYQCIEEIWLKNTWKTMKKEKWYTKKRGKTNVRMRQV